jgi:hypothetical protein
MARFARAVAPGILHHITQRGNRRHGSRNEYGVRRIQGVKLEIVSGIFLKLQFPVMETWDAAPPRAPKTEE